jgi:polyhydroxyalkanoate synthesis repressor PhaR
MKTIKRYPNRKLYDLTESRYITLDEIAEHVRAGGEVSVVDSKSGEDITAVTLAQVLLGEEKKNRPVVPIQRLMTLLQTGGEFLHKRLAPVTTIRDEAEKTVQRLIRGEPAEEIREFLAHTQRAYEEVQHRADEQLQMVVTTVRNFAPILKEVDRLRREVATMRERLDRLEGMAPPAPPEPPASRKGTTRA